jgi:SAM-dependent methyltransferase
VSDADAFHDFEQAGWQRAAGGYADAFGALTAQAIDPLLASVGAEAGVRLLDVATGPGYVAAAAAARGADVVAVDFAQAMVDHARRHHAGLDVRIGDAEALPFESASFDAVVASFAMLHFARPERALGEMRRVLRPGGRVAFTVWASPERAIGFRIVLDAIAAHGSVAPPVPPGPPFFRFSDHGECERVLRTTGFTSPTVVETPMIWRLPARDALFDAMAQGAVRTGAMLNAQPLPVRAALRDAIQAATADYAVGDAVELPMPCVLVSAVAAKSHRDC